MLHKTLLKYLIDDIFIFKNNWDDNKLDIPKLNMVNL
jgi:hypothetical protein